LRERIKFIQIHVGLQQILYSNLVYIIEIASVFSFQISRGIFDIV